MKVIYPKSMKKESGSRTRETDQVPSLITVRNAPIWDDLNLAAANTHVGTFLHFLKNTHDDDAAFSSDLINALDVNDASPERAIEILRDTGATMTFTDLLALLGPAVQYALSLADNADGTESPETIEKFVISLVLSLAETTNKFSGEEKLLPLDDELIQGITVTVRNIIFAYRKDYSHIDYGNQVSAVAHCLSLCCKKK